MPIELSHIGEDLVAEMLRSVAERLELDRVACAVTGRTLAEDVRDERLGGPLAFRADDTSLVVRDGPVAHACDGEQKVDVLCTGGDRAIAFEAKLGETRMAAAEFRKRFCTRCERSKHADARLSGSMVAVLERSLPIEGPPVLVAEVGGQRWTVAEPWWLVVRDAVLKKWLRTGDVPVKAARILSFDALARVYGPRRQFDQMVQRVVGSDFAGRWRIPLGDG